MNNLYDKNGLMFWTSDEIKLRKMFETYFSTGVFNLLQFQNSAFQMVQVEAPILTPREFINKNYSDDDMFCVDGDLVLRPETTMGSYAAAKTLLSGFHNPKFRPPIIVWQHGKSFRKEQDQPTKFMRLKEFYQMEFQIIFSPSTANDYSVSLYAGLLNVFSRMLGKCRLEESDRLPDYSEQTMDIVCEQSEMEICSMSKRTDFEGYKVIEIAIGSDRCVYNFLRKE